MPKCAHEDKPSPQRNCEHNSNRFKISSRSFESHHWQIVTTFEVRDVQMQVVNRRSSRVCDDAGSIREV